MAHPKRRQSKTRTLKRRTHDKAVAPTLAVCPNCGARLDCIFHFLLVSVSFNTLFSDFAISQPSASGCP